MKFSIGNLFWLTLMAAMLVFIGKHFYDKENNDSIIDIERATLVPSDHQVVFGDRVIETITGKVVSVYDGDSLTLLVDNEQIKVRLAAVDTPERKRGQPFNKVARQFLSDSVFGKTVQVHIIGDAGWNRDVGFVVVDGVNVNAELIKAGLGWHYKEFNHDETLARYELEAREARRGLWGGADPIAPWEFRKLEKQRSKSKDLKQ